jgi:adenylate cyclase
MAKVTTEEMWERMLTGNVPRLHSMRRMWGALPSPPRCKLCNAPFRGPGSVVMRVIGYGPSPLNRRLCNWCIRAISKKPGGAEVEISLLFADVRGSTAIAERLPPEEYSRLIARFYGTAAEVIDEWDGIVDKFVGDEAVALFIPSFSENDPAANAMAAARELLEQADVPLGVGVHAGKCFVGTVGEGDPVNATARLTSLAGAGEVLISAEAAEAGGLETAGLEQRTLELRGREQTIDAWVCKGSDVSLGAAA